MNTLWINDKIVVGLRDVLLLALKKPTQQQHHRPRFFSDRFNIRYMGLIDEKVGGWRVQSSNDGGIGHFCATRDPPFRDCAFTRTSGFWVWLLGLVTDGFGLGGRVLEWRGHACCFTWSAT